MKSKKLLMMIFAIVLIVNSALQSTLAFIIDETDSILNIFNPVKSPVNSLTISKTVEHPYGDDYVIPENITFDFLVELGAAYSGKILTSDRGSITCDSNGNFYVTIAVNSSFGIDGIVEGTEVKVTEVSELNGFTVKEGTDAVQTLTILPEGGAKAEFINVYTPAALNPDNIFLTGEKQLEGRDWQDGDVFEFLLEALGDDGEWVELSKRQTVYSVDSADYNRFNFSADIFDFEITTIGEYKFRISEIEGELDNVDYDKTVNYFTLIATDDDMDGKIEIASVEGKQNITASYDEENGIYNLHVIFNNTFVPDPEDITIEIVIDKTVNNTGDKEIGADGFEFIIEDIENGETIELVTDKNGKASFELDFSHEDIGLRSYKVTEVIGNVIGVTYDETVYDVTIDVDVVDNQLVAVINVNGESAEEIELAFTNIYHVVEEPIAPGDSTNPIFYIAMAAMALAGVVMLLLAKKQPVGY